MAFRPVEVDSNVKFKDSFTQNMNAFRREGERDLEKGLSPPRRPSQFLDQSPVPSPRASTPRPSLVLSNSGKALIASNSGKALIVSNSSKSLGISNSGKRYDKKKYVKQVTGRHNDTELHLAAQRGDVVAVRQILGEIDAQMMGTLSGAEFDAEVICFCISINI